MTITFVSNFLNHHQTPFCEEMHKMIGDKFTFISTIDMPDIFLKNGYPDCRNYSYNVKAYLNSTAYNNAINIINESKIVIIGSAPDTYIKDRLKQNKPTFKYCERLFKESKWGILNPFKLYHLIMHHSIYRNKKLYLLSAGGFVKNEFKNVFAYPNKMYKWGYFTALIQNNYESRKKQDESIINIIWVGRLIKWKHPEHAIKLAKNLKQKGYKFQLNMIGNGYLYDSLSNYISNNSLDGFINLLGNKQNNEVLQIMQKSDIFLFTSDRNEGWGAVLNEAMGAGCAVVVSNEIGSVPYLIKNNTNGLIYKSGDINQLTSHVELLINNKNIRQHLSLNGYNTIVKLWNPEKAAQNFIALCESILKNKEIVIDEGPCSNAD